MSRVSQSGDNGKGGFNNFRGGLYEKGSERALMRGKLIKDSQGPDVSKTICD